MTLDYATYVGQDAVGLAEMIGRRQVSAREVVEAAIDRAEAVNPKINAIVERLYAKARSSADAASPGPFRGAPYAMKDLGHPIGGVRLTSGSRAFSEIVSSEDGETYRRAAAAGLIVIATTTSPEFGLTTTTESSLHGWTRNPWDLSRSAGGSSGGSAALVAAGVVPAAHATDGGGSIRVPASCCGLVGLKVSRGRTPSGHERTESWLGLGVSHAVTRSVRDSAALLDALCAPEAGSRYVAPPPPMPFLSALDRPPPRLRVALQRRAPTGREPDADCLAALHSAAALLADLGHEVEPAEPDLEGEGLAQAMGRLVMTEIARTMDQRSAALGRPLGAEDMEASTLTMVEIGRRVTGAEILAANDAFMRAAIAMGRFQQRYDVVLSPTVATAPPPLGLVGLDQSLEAYSAAISAFSPYTALHNQTGQPAVSLPLHWSAAGLPIGVQFAGRIGEEALLLSLAAELETARPWFDRRPPLTQAQG